MGVGAGARVGTGDGVGVGLRVAPGDGVGVAIRVGTGVGVGVSVGTGVARAVPASSSTTDTATLPVADPYPPPLAVWLKTAVSFSASPSDAALTLTDCAVLQLAVVNESDAGYAVTSALLLAMLTVTSPLGRFASFTL